MGCRRGRDEDGEVFVCYLLKKFGQSQTNICPKSDAANSTTIKKTGQ